APRCRRASVRDREAAAPVAPPQAVPGLAAAAGRRGAEEVAAAGPDRAASADLRAAESTPSFVRTSVRPEPPALAAPAARWRTPTRRAQSAGTTQDGSYRGDLRFHRRGVERFATKRRTLDAFLSNRHAEARTVRNRNGAVRGDLDGRVDEIGIEVPLAARDVAGQREVRQCRQVNVGGAADPRL